QEESLLVDILQLAERYEGLTEPSPLPEQAQTEPTLTPATSRRTSAAPRRTPAPHTPRTGKTPRATTPKATRQPLLGDLLLTLLAGHDEPRPAKELRDELMTHHPDRTPTPQVVRNTLESLVAKGRIQRHKHDRSVMYTLT
ncbi:hypothetical protein ABZ990_01865, partial [Streptomyces sp. NPDC046203]|uniref:hypothetical protein n=1 Tax=Streptomyces sp. NPDC046203 TaxID=3154602 RepID=UPI0033E0694C